MKCKGSLSELLSVLSFYFYFFIFFYEKGRKDSSYIAQVNVLIEL